MGLGGQILRSPGYSYPEEIYSAEKAKFCFVKVFMSLCLPESLRLPAFFWLTYRLMLFLTPKTILL
jgi:hypothetical protein